MLEIFKKKPQKPLILDIEVNNGEVCAVWDGEKLVKFIQHPIDEGRALELRRMYEEA